ncbi:MAG: orotate phosphoribosyltransferase [Candidatus Altiarchaeota archaeon]|nr:orotate phosphoribosyltransferase [Candidatus Altiarchaeota archaeon]MBU4406450.1 orotate phosphoribosyltransferase [Candidatus Altiarchaeota archaeon]
MNITSLRENLLNLIKKEALSKQPVKLSSGKESSYYIDCRLVTLSPAGSLAITEILFDMLKDDEIDAFGGPTLGADPICGSLAAVSQQKGKPLPSFIIRKEPKAHGKGKWIEGPLKPGTIVAIFDDVATSGGSLLKAIKAVEGMGCKVARVIVLVDRGEGAKEKLAEEGHCLEAIFTKEDLGV